MQVKVTYVEADSNGQGEFLKIETPKYTVKFGDMEPEDASLARDLNCVFNIEQMLEEAYMAGRDGEPLEWIQIHLDDEK